jgi:hypothetical protein
LQLAIGQLTSLGMNTTDATTLANWEWTQHVAGYSDASIADMLITTPLFNQYFPEIAARQNAGLPPVTAAQIVSYKDTVAQYASQYGIPQQFVDQFTSQWITQDVSAAEVGQRLQDYQQAAFQSNPAVVQQLQTLYGVTPGELISFFADPTTALPLIQQRFQSAQIAGQAQVAGNGRQHAALGCAVELGDDEAGQAQCIVKSAHLGQGVLAGVAVNHQEHFLRACAQARSIACFLHHALHFFQLFHQVQLRG